MAIIERIKGIEKYALLYLILIVIMTVITLFIAGSLLYLFLACFIGMPLLLILIFVTSIFLYIRVDRKIVLIVGMVCSIVIITVFYNIGVLPYQDDPVIIGYEYNDELTIQVNAIENLYIHKIEDEYYLFYDDLGILETYNYKDFTSNLQNKIYHNNMEDKSLLYIYKKYPEGNPLWVNHGEVIVENGVIQKLPNDNLYNTSRYRHWSFNQSLTKLYNNNNSFLYKGPVFNLENNISYVACYIKNTNENIAQLTKFGLANQTDFIVWFEI